MSSTPPASLETANNEPLGVAAPVDIQVNNLPSSTELPQVHAPIQHQPILSAPVTESQPPNPQFDDRKESLTLATLPDDIFPSSLPAFTELSNDDLHHILLAELDSLAVAAMPFRYGSMVTGTQIPPVPACKCCPAPLSPPAATSHTNKASEGVEAGSPVSMASAPTVLHTLFQSQVIHRYAAAYQQHYSLPSIDPNNADSNGDATTNPGSAGSDFGKDNSRSVLPHPLLSLSLQEDPLLQGPLPSSSLRARILLLLEREREVIRRERLICLAERAMMDDAVAMRKRALAVAVCARETHRQMNNLAVLGAGEEVVMNNGQAGEFGGVSDGQGYNNSQQSYEATSGHVTVTEPTKRDNTAMMSPVAERVSSKQSNAERSSPKPVVDKTDKPDDDGEEDDEDAESDDELQLEMAVPSLSSVDFAVLDETAAADKETRGVTPSVKDIIIDPNAPRMVSPDVMLSRPAQLISPEETTSPMPFPSSISPQPLLALIDWASAEDVVEADAWLYQLCSDASQLAASLKNIEKTYARARVLELVGALRWAICELYRRDRELFYGADMNVVVPNLDALIEATPMVDVSLAPLVDILTQSGTTNIPAMYTSIQTSEATLPQFPPPPLPLPLPISGLSVPCAFTSYSAYLHAIYEHCTSTAFNDIASQERSQDNKANGGAGGARPASPGSLKAMLSTLGSLLSAHLKEEHQRAQEWVKLVGNEAEKEPAATDAAAAASAAATATSGHVSDNTVAYDDSRDSMSSFMEDRRSLIEDPVAEGGDKTATAATVPNGAEAAPAAGDTTSSGAPKAEGHHSTVSKAALPQHLPAILTILSQQLCPLLTLLTEKPQPSAEHDTTSHTDLVVTVDGHPRPGLSAADARPSPKSESESSRQSGKHPSHMPATPSRLPPLHGDLPSSARKAGSKAAGASSHTPSPRRQFRNHSENSGAEKSKAFGSQLKSPSKLRVPRKGVSEELSSSPDSTPRNSGKAQHPPTHTGNRVSPIIPRLDIAKTVEAPNPEPQIPTESQKLAITLQHDLSELLTPATTPATIAQALSDLANTVQTHIASCHRPHHHHHKSHAAHPHAATDASNASGTPAHSKHFPRADPTTIARFAWSAPAPLLALLMKRGVPLGLTSAPHAAAGAAGVAGAVGAAGVPVGSPTGLAVAAADVAKFTAQQKIQPPSALTVNIEDDPVLPMNVSRTPGSDSNSEFGAAHSSDSPSLRPHLPKLASIRESPITSPSNTAKKSPMHVVIGQNSQFQLVQSGSLPPQLESARMTSLPSSAHSLLPSSGFKTDDGALSGDVQEGLRSRPRTLSPSKRMSRLSVPDDNQGLESVRGVSSARFNKSELDSVKIGSASRRGDKKGRSGSESARGSLIGSAGLESQRGGVMSRVPTNVNDTQDAFQFTSGGQWQLNQNKPSG